MYCICFCMFDGIFPRIRQNNTGNLCAVALAERPAAQVPFRQYQPSQPPFTNVDSAALNEGPACHFGGESAQFAILVHFANQSFDQTRMGFSSFRPLTINLNRFW